MIKISQNSEFTSERTSPDKLLVAVKDFTYEPEKAVRDRFFSPEGRGRVDRDGVDAVRDKMFFAGALIDPAAYPKTVVDQMIKSGAVAYLGDLPGASPLRGRFVPEIVPIPPAKAVVRNRPLSASPPVAGKPAPDAGSAGDGLNEEDNEDSLEEGAQSNLV